MLRRQREYDSEEVALVLPRLASPRLAVAPLCVGFWTRVNQPHFRGLVTRDEARGEAPRKCLDGTTHGCYKSNINLVTLGSHTLK